MSSARYRRKLEGSSLRVVGVASVAVPRSVILMDLCCLSDAAAIDLCVSYVCWLCAILLMRWIAVVALQAIGMDATELVCRSSWLR